MENNMLNKVTKKDCIDAIEYLWDNVEEMTSDKRYYTEILLKKVANLYNIQLIEEGNNE